MSNERFEGRQPSQVPREAIEHAWNWFALHAGQRMQSFNFFLVATAFLVAGYATVLKEHREVAAAIALLGAWVSLWFNRMEKRTKQLVDAGQAALTPFQQRLAELTANPALVILPSVERASAGAALYSTVINVIQWTIVFAFLCGAAYAGWPLIGGVNLRADVTPIGTASVTAKGLNAAGLLIALAAGILMAFYPPRLPQFTKEGAPTISWIGDPTEEGKRKGRRQWRLSVVAQCLLVLGFLLQIIALLVP